MQIGMNSTNKRRMAADGSSRPSEDSNAAFESELREFDDGEHQNATLQDTPKRVKYKVK